MHDDHDDAPWKIRRLDRTDAAAKEARAKHEVRREPF